MAANVCKNEFKLQLFLQVMDQVYGPYNTTSWRPKPFENCEPRYLWTDAFGVVNFLTAYAESGKEQYLSQALTLVDAVHGVLGFTRDGSQRLGAATAERPTLGGLRIGKPKPEGPGMSDDGQYYHYLTKWMFALNRLALVTKTPSYNQWAVDLAKAVHPAFVYRSEKGLLRMHWKVSIDLSHPLVPSEGGLDPFDGYTIYKLLQNSSDDTDVLSNEICELRDMVERKYGLYSTDDALDAGEALWLSSWFPEENWAKRLSDVAGKAINRMWTNGEFSDKKLRRLAFREFGTTIGVQEHPELMKSGWAERVETLHKFWQNDLYSRDADITPVMFCTSLIPGVSSPHFALK